MSYYTQKLKEIRQTLQELHSVPVFEPIKWKRMNSPIYTNCYAYCLNLDVTDPETIIFVPGCISNEHAETNIMNLSDLINNTKKDLHFLGISYREDDGSPLQDGEYKIAIYNHPIFPDTSIDFHFTRQDKDGNWSEKLGWDGPIVKCDKDEGSPPIFDPVYGPFLTTVLVLRLPTR